MKIPDWAERALNSRKPLPPAFPKNDDGPNPDRLKAWNIFNERFRSRWSELEADRWAVPKDHPEYACLRAHLVHPPDEYVRQRILECAVTSAWELGRGKKPEQVASDLKTLDSLNEQISGVAGKLASLFRARQTILESNGWTDRQIDIDETQPDPFCFFGALELALTRPDVEMQRAAYGGEISSYLTIAATGSNPNPNWIDLLNEVSHRMPRVASMPDPAAAGGTNRTAWSPWCLRLIGRLHESVGGGFQDGFFLRCLTNDQLAALAIVALDAPPEAINAEQMRGLKRTYLKNAAFIHKAHPDD